MSKAACAVRWDDMVRHTCQGHGRTEAVAAHRCACGAVLVIKSMHSPDLLIVDDPPGHQDRLIDAYEALPDWGKDWFNAASPDPMTCATCGHPETVHGGWARPDGSCAYRDCECKAFSGKRA